MQVNNLRPISHIVLLFVSLANADACDSNSPGVSGDAGTRIDHDGRGQAGTGGGSAERDGGTTSIGGHGSPGKEAGDSEGGVLCDQSIADYCQTSGPVPCQWPSNMAALCPPVRSPTFSASVGRGCTQYQYLHEVTNVDIGFDAYYDVSTGRLIAVISRRYSGGGSGHCIVGPTGFVDPAEPNQVLPGGCAGNVALDCADAGATP